MSERAAWVRTPRLLLRCFSVDDAPALKAAVDENLAHLRPWMDWAATEPTPLAGVEERLARYARDFEEDADWVYAVLDADDERLLGVVGVHVRPGPGEREIGYWLRADCEGQGYMTEAVAALTRAAFERHGARRVVIRCDPRNVRSIAVARRVGYAYERTRVADTPDAGGDPHARMIWIATSPPASTGVAGAP
jgi:RimJ/RimL family protein N-acetyltransferase